MPEWVFEVDKFWSSGQISDKEFINAIQFLQKRDIIRLAFSSDYDTLTNFHLTVSFQDESLLKSYTNCSGGWYVTGYYIPEEKDFEGNHINIEKIGLYKSDFIKEVKREGWGLTESDDYLGWYDNAFHLNHIPQDEYEDRLEFPTVAVDSAFINPDANVWIPSLPHPWNKVLFFATDSGPSIKGKHVDVFTGQGDEAEKMTEMVTGFGNKICLKN